MVHALGIVSHRGRVPGRTSTKIKVQLVFQNADFTIRDAEISITAYRAPPLSWAYNGGTR